MIILLFLLPSDLFTNETLVVLYILGNRDQTVTYLLLDTGATSIALINKKMVRYMYHVLKILFLLLAKPKLLKKFNKKPVQSITHVIYSILIIQSYYKLLVPMLMTLLN